MENKKEKLKTMIIIVLLIIVASMVVQHKREIKKVPNNIISKSHTKTIKNSSYTDTFYINIFDTVLFYKPVSVINVNDSVNRWDYKIDEENIKGNLATFCTGNITHQVFDYVINSKTIIKIDSVEINTVDTLLITESIPKQERKWLLGADIFLQNKQVLGFGANISFKTKLDYQYSVGYNVTSNVNYFSLGVKVPLNLKK